MQVRKTWVAPLVLAIWSCGPNIQNPEAIRAGVVEHLTSRGDLDLKSMDVSVSSVSFRKDEADATVVFRAKGSTDAGGLMSMSYTLEKKGDKWVVKGKRSVSGGHGDGAPSAMPPGHPPTEGPKP
jgi:hypothetical protein